MKRYFDPARCNFLFLLPLAAMALSDEDAMNAEELRNEFVGNTVVAQFSEGTSYAFVEPGGVARGLHPTQGPIIGRYEISDDGVVCVTWPLSSEEIKNCDKTVPKGDQKYSWAGQTIEVVPGDPKGLGSQVCFASIDASPFVKAHRRPSGVSRRQQTDWTEHPQGQRAPQVRLNQVYASRVDPEYHALYQDSEDESGANELAYNVRTNGPDLGIVNRY